MFLFLVSSHPLIAFCQILLLPFIIFIYFLFIDLELLTYYLDFRLSFIRANPPPLPPLLPLPFLLIPSVLAYLGKTHIF